MSERGVTPARVRVTSSRRSAVSARSRALATDLDEQTELGDVYLVGRLPLSVVTREELDRLLGAVLEAADGAFNPLLELGFASAIRKEYAWRVERGESTRNLDAFAHLTQRPS